MSPLLQKALAEISIAEDKAAKLLRKEYPESTWIRWEWGGRAFSGTVIDHGGGLRLRVRNHRTGRDRWIYAGHILPNAPRPVRKGKRT